MSRMVELRGTPLNNDSNAVAWQPPTTPGIEKQCSFGRVANLSAPSPAPDGPEPIARYYQAARQLARPVELGWMQLRQADACVLAMAIRAEREGLTTDFLATARFLAWLIRDERKAFHHARAVTAGAIHRVLRPLAQAGAPGSHMQHVTHGANAAAGWPLLDFEAEAIIAEELAIARQARREDAA